MSFFPHGGSFKLTVQDLRRVKQILECQGRKIEIIREVKDVRQTD